MNANGHCPRCGSLIPADAPRGSCPACFFRKALGDEDGGNTGLTLSPAAGASVPGSLAVTLGLVPRVLLRDTDPVTGPGPVVRPGSPEMPAPGERSERLQLLGEVARGGMGAILKGRDTDIGRDLAVKVLLEQHVGNPELVRRFVEEAQIAGQLQHPGVVPIYELGVLPGRRPYIAMKLVKDHTLATLLDDRRGPYAERSRLLGVFEQVCMAMAYAPALASVRDPWRRPLKPSATAGGPSGMT